MTLRTSSVYLREKREKRVWDGKEGGREGGREGASKRIREGASGRDHRQLRQMEGPANPSRGHQHKRKNE